jgi:predicted nuclease of predicted toxin-antitoxin system
MKLLLDENLPKKLKLDFTEFDIYTVREKNWNGIENGKLLQLMIDDNFTALLTFDKNLQHQQNFTKYSITVFVLTAPNNSYNELTKLTAKIKEHLSQSPLQTSVIIVDVPKI